MFFPVLKEKIENFTNEEKCIAGDYNLETVKRAYFLREYRLAERR